MSATARVLVLLAARNGGQWIGQQIDSVLAQVGVDVRLLVRDDGSTDDTRDVVSALMAAHPRITLAEDHRATGSASANFFALTACADLEPFDYVAFCDQDDSWQPNKLERAVRRLREEGAAGGSAAVLARWSDGRSKVLSQSPATRHADYLFEGAGQGCTFVFDVGVFARLRDELARQSGMLPRLHYHDWSLYALVRTFGLRWTFDPEPTMVYRQHDGNDTGARDSGAGIMRRLELIRTGWYRAQVAAVAELVLRVNPADAAAARWIGLDASTARRRWGGRVRRLAFVARHGRRRALDRAILVAAVALGYL